MDKVPSVLETPAVPVIESSDPAGLPAKAELAARHPDLVRRLDASLLEAWAAADGAGPVSPATAARSANASPADSLVVVVQCDSNAVTAVAAGVGALGGQVLRASAAHVKAIVLPAALAEVAGLPGVSFVRPTITARPKNVITEGRAAMRVGPWHTAGLTGRGAKVAILDSGFAGVAAAKTAGELPTSAVEVDFTGSGMSSGGDNHGTACAEIFYDIAPDAQLHLLKSLDPSDDGAAVNYCIAQGIHLISQSAGYDALNFHDGVAYSSITPHPVALVNTAAAAGILWVNAAGNEQLQHGLIAWQDENGDGRLDWNASSGSINRLWNGGNPISAGKTLEVYVTWNEWPVTDQDFDVVLYRLAGSTWTSVASSERFQTGTQAPRESIVFTTSVSGDYGFAIKRYNASRTPHFIVRTYPYELFYYGYANFSQPVKGSILIPADASSCLAVGAIDQADYVTGPIEPFSSLGPNNGALSGNHPSVMKPDLCGPDFVSTAAHGAFGFGGTSAATPHVAGLAALVKQILPNATGTEIRRYLESHARDLGIAGRDNTYGFGAAVLPVPGPVLAILQIGNKVVVSWPSAFTNYQLQTATELGAWQPVAQSPVAGDGFLFVTNSMSGRGFYRLEAR